MSDNIYKRVANYVTGLFEKNTHPNLLFHNIGHTKKVVERAQEIAAHYQLTEADTLTIYIAAWFHDTGHLFTDVEKHVEKSVELMRAYMAKEKEANDEVTERVANCILVTKIPYAPKNLIEEILCDADTYHFGTKEFKATNKLVKREFALRGYDILLDDWTNNTIDLLEKHTFFTTYCKILLEQRKKKNVEWLKRKEQRVTADNTHHNIFESVQGDAKDTKQNGTLLVKGLQTIMRITAANHLQLSEMADRKANILITVTAIMISVILSVLAEKLADHPHLTIPVILFLVSALVTIIIAILSTLPKVTEGVFTKEDVLNKKTNLLFFGNFYKSSLEEYQWAMSVLMKDTEYMYSVLVKDIHQLGCVLGKKYKLVRLSYNVFMIGLTVTVIAFFVATAISYKRPAERAVITNSSSSPL